MEPYHAPFSTKQTIQIDKNSHMYKIQGERVKNLAGEENKMKPLCEGLDNVREMLVGKEQKAAGHRGEVLKEENSNTPGVMLHDRNLHGSGSWEIIWRIISLYRQKMLRTRTQRRWNGQF